ncbi:MAG: mannose-1-phosphate guanylyltransferase [Anaerolineae bacterium]|nr:mannose-1-phosphate guanylyltransferase [Anaerolineae bacterium]
MYDLYALIMAGGGGTRLWPRSRQSRPKQFLDIGSPHSLLREAYLRIEPIIPAERILVITGQNYHDAVCNELPEIPASNILGEPVGRGTAPAVGLAAEVLASRVNHGIMAVLTADHIIRNQARFRDVLKAATAAAREGRIVLIGIQPTEPNTGYGYIETADRLNGRDLPLLRVASFKEKPTREVAELFLAAGNYFWNSGMFVWSLDTIRAEMRRHLPDTAERCAAIGRAWDTPEREPVLADLWSSIQTETIDYGVVEKAHNVAVIPADIGWNDVGSWSALFDVLPVDAQDNIVEGEYISVDSRNNLIYSPNRLVAALGVEDLVIVDTDDVLLILPRHRAQDVRALVAELRKRGRPDLL